MTSGEYNQLQFELSALLEKRDVSGRRIIRSQDYRDAVLAAKSVLHNFYNFHCAKEDEEDGETE